MPDTTDEMPLLRLEESLLRHEIDTSVFAPFVIARLRGAPDDIEAVIQKHLIEASTHKERSVRVRLQWEPHSAFTRPVAIQERVLTEWAALGLTCVLLPELLGLRIVSVAVEGESFDYRVSDGITIWGLEISGTMTEDRGELRERLRLKIRGSWTNSVLQVVPSHSTLTRRQKCSKFR